VTHIAIKSQHAQPLCFTAFPEGWSVINAILYAAETFEWARGWLDMERSAIWPFNPDMIVTVGEVSKTACEWAAEEFGGRWAEVLMAAQQEATIQ
jgi:hypothetical protein